MIPCSVGPFCKVLQILMFWIVKSYFEFQMLEPYPAFITWTNFIMETFALIPQKPNFKSRFLIVCLSARSLGIYFSLFWFFPWHINAWKQFGESSLVFSQPNFIVLIFDPVTLLNQCHQIFDLAFCAKITIFKAFKLIFSGGSWWWMLSVGLFNQLMCFTYFFFRTNEQKYPSPQILFFFRLKRGTNDLKKMDL